MRFQIEKTVIPIWKDFWVNSLKNLFMTIVIQMLSGYTMLTLFV